MSKNRNIYIYIYIVSASKLSLQYEKNNFIMEGSLIINCDDLWFRLTLSRPHQLRKACKLLGTAAYIRSDQDSVFVEE